MIIRRGIKRTQPGETVNVKKMDTSETKTIKWYEVKAGIEFLGKVGAVSPEKAQREARIKYGDPFKYAVLKYTITEVKK